LTIVCLKNIANSLDFGELEATTLPLGYRGGGLENVESKDAK